MSNTMRVRQELAIDFAVVTRTEDAVRVYSRTSGEGFSTEPAFAMVEALDAQIGLLVEAIRDVSRRRDDAWDKAMESRERA